MEIGFFFPGISAQAVVDDDTGLEGANHFDQLPGFPGFAAHMLELRAFQAFIVIGKIEPHNIDLAVIGQKLSDLIVEVGHILIPVMGHILIEFVVPHRMLAVAVVRVIGMMPVGQGVVEADLKALRTESIHIFPDQIPAAFGVGASLASSEPHL